MFYGTFEEKQDVVDDSGMSWKTECCITMDKEGIVRGTSASKFEQSGKKVAELEGEINGAVKWGDSNTGKIRYVEKRTLCDQTRADYGTVEVSAEITVYERTKKGLPAFQVSGSYVVANEINPLTLKPSFLTGRVKMRTPLPTDVTDEVEIISQFDHTVGGGFVPLERTNKHGVKEKDYRDYQERIKVSRAEFMTGRGVCVPLEFLDNRSKNPSSYRCLGKNRRLNNR